MNIYFQIHGIILISFDVKNIGNYKTDYQVSYRNWLVNNYYKKSDLHFVCALRVVEMVGVNCYATLCTW